jgi:DNA-binding transcriptional regulator YdaS (Cro superfamily)
MEENPSATAVRAAGGPSALAAALGVSSAAVSQWVAGVRQIPAERCPAIERATQGAVAVETLRADVQWSRIPDPAWPHPAGRPVIDVARPVAAQEA